MGCFRCEMHDWPDPQEPLADHRYCIFHAPIEHKGISVEAFNELVFARIDAIQASSNSLALCDFCGTVFPGDINFSHYHRDSPLPNIRFLATKFYGKALFGGATFGGETDFSAAMFNEVAIFDGATFDKTANFKKTVFCETAKFILCTFTNEVKFDWSAFADWADFSKATFMERAMFSNAEFFKEAYFIMSNFTMGGDFNYTKFGKLTSFRKAIFEGVINFSECISDNPLIFRELRSVKDLRFFGMNMSASDFLHTPLTNIKFQNVKWENYPGVRYCLPIEDNPEQAGIDWNDRLFKDRPARYAAVAEFYRQMKKRSRDEQNDPEASRWHYAEKEVQLKLHRLEKPLSFERWMVEAYRVISRYGEDPWQALTFLGYLLVALFYCLSIGSIPLLGELPAEISWNKVDKFFHCYFQYILFVPKPDWSPPVGIFDAIALLISRLLIPIQAAIFAFALRNKLHR